MRGISLDEIVATTKIGTRLLRALEDEQFDLLPGGIFNKSYVRAYAKCVGIDEDEAVAAYLDAANETPPDTRVIAHQHASIHSDRPAQARSGFPVVPVLILLVVIAGGWGGWKIYQDRQHDRELRSADSAGTSPQSSSGAPAASNSAMTPATALPAQTAATPSGTSSPQSQTTTPRGATESAKPAVQKQRSSIGAAGTTTVGADSGNSFEVVIRPKDPAWVSVQSDGKVVVRGVIKPPDVKTVHATGQVVFWTGNAGAVEVSFNGKNVPLPGGVNQEGVLVFDSRGLVARPSPAATQ